MALKVIDDIKLTNIANAIRDNLGTEKQYRDDDMPDAVSEIKAAGKAEGESIGYQSGYDIGLAAGAKSEYDRFWDDIQNYGNRIGYNGAFCKWGSTSINPKHPIASQQLYETFRDNPNLESVDWSSISYPDNSYAGYISCYAMAMNCPKLLSVDADIIFSTSAGAAAGQYMFYGCTSLKRVQKIYSTERVSYTSAFKGCESLAEVIFDGVIGTAGLDTSASPLLNKASSDSIMECLSDTASGLSVTLNKTAIDKAYETSEGAADGSESEEWLALVATKPNWTINLV